MADIEVKCFSCGKIVHMSEYADSKSFVCGACGTPLTKPKSPELSDGNAGHRLRIRNVDAAPPVEAPPPNVQQEVEAAAVIVRQRQYLLMHLSASWLVFILIGGLMAYLRYGNTLPRPYFQWLREYGPYAALAFHVYIILLATRDSMLQTVLCLFIPFYSFYYLFTVSDNFYGRAVIGGCLVGIGWDSAVFLQDRFTETVTTVKAWIASGG